jgi:DNA-binding CsgD family transcriptional regulator
MGDMISARQLSDLITSIYDCAIDPSRWPVALEAIRLAIGGANASLDLVAVPSGASLLSVITNIPAPYDKHVKDFGQDTITLWGGFESLAATPLDEPGTLLRTTPHFETMDLPLLTDWARPQGLADVMGIWLARDAEAFGLLGFGRLREAGPYGDRELDIARLLAPHLQRAATINRLLDLAALQKASFAALFDSLAAPILIVAGDMRLIHANDRARQMLARGQPLRVRANLVAAGHLGTHRALLSAIAQATSDGSAMERKGLGIPLPQDDGSIGALHVLPLGADTKTAAIFVARAISPFVAANNVIAALFSLTPSEGRVFDHIASGRTVAQAATTLGIGESTVRTHLLRLYDKTGVRRQAELVHMAASLAVPVQ